MKKIMIAVALMVGILSVSEANAQGYNNGYHGHHRGHAISKEQVQQHQRIKHGRATGQLNRREAHRLQAEQRHIQSLKQLAKADGRVTRKERAYIDAEQARASAHIYRQKHDRQ